MSLTVNIHDAKTNLSRLLSRVGKGEEIIIARAGKPVARLVPVDSKVSQRTAGSAKGKVVISESFNEPLPDSLLEEFEK